VSGAKGLDGTVRLAATGAGSWGARLPSAEAAAGDPEAAGKAALEDVSPHDDALASAWYRAKVLPVLVRRVLTEMEESS
jgi:CO/xanthine dehydrogenase FAD-binding subunit